VEFLEKYKGKLFDELCQIIKCGPDDLLNVINLGDLFSQNTMFIRNPEKRVYNGQVFLDMQVESILDSFSNLFCFLRISILN